MPKFFYRRGAQRRADFYWFFCRNWEILGNFEEKKQRQLGNGPLMDVPLWILWKIVFFCQFQHFFLDIRIHSFIYWIHGSLAGWVL